MNRKLIFTLIVALLACVMLPAGWAAADPGDTEAVDAVSFIPGEPNNTFATATPIGFSYRYVESYFLVATDLDYYRLNLDVAGKLEATVYLSSEYTTTPLRVELALYDASQTWLAGDTDCGDPAEAEKAVPAGVYYLVVKPCAGTLDIDRNYQLQVYNEPVEWELNNNLTTANVINLGDVHGAIEPAGDIDFYRFDALAGEYLFFEVYTQDVFWPALTLLDANGLELITAPTDGCWGNDNTACITYLIPSAGTYYLRVRSATHPTGGGAYAISMEPFGVSESEPNNTPAQATVVPNGASVHGRFGGRVTLTDPFDYFSFTGQAGEGVVFGNNNDDGNGGSLYGVELTLYDSLMNPVPLTNTEIDWAVLPADGVYYLKVSLVPDESPEAGYNAFIGRLTGNEPENNLMSGAELVIVGQQILAESDYPCDVDWYRFQGRAGDVFPIEYPAPGPSPFWHLYDAVGNLLFDTVVLPSDETYYLKVVGSSYYEGEGSFCNRGSYEAVAGRALWISADYDGLGGNTAIKQQDIVTRDTAPGKWQIVFDASDVGITKDVTAFEVMPNGSILMSLDAGQNVTGLGWVAPQDIIRFVPTTLGPTTAGTFQWYLDGSDVGLTTADEKIDAIYLQPYADPLRISTFGSGSVPRQSGGWLNFADEDLINFVGAQYGQTSAGKWRMNLDGSTIPGMGAEDLNAVARVELVQGYESPSLFVMRDAYSINGVKGGIYDVLSDRPTWRLVVQGLADKKIDGLAIGPAWMP